MTRHRLFNLCMALAIVAIVGAVIYLESTSSVASNAAVVTSPSSTRAEPSSAADSQGAEASTTAPATTGPVTSQPPTSIATRASTTRASTAPSTSPAADAPPPPTAPQESDPETAALASAGASALSPPSSGTEPASTPTTVAPTTIPSTTVPPPERGAVAVVVSSASTAGQRVEPAVYLLSLNGWSNIRGVNGSIPVTDGVVYYVDGYRSAAELLAVDLSLPASAIAPIADAPPVAGLADGQLLAYLGAG